MSFIATLVAPQGLSAGDISRASDAVRGTAAAVLDGTACDIATAMNQSAARSALEAALPHVDVIVQSAAHRNKRLLVADMDSTMITVECIDELADYAGIKPQIAAITQRAMRGELDFRAALAERVALLGGLRESVIEQCLNERVRPMAGARTLIQTMRARGCRTVLVSGGFTRFAGPVAGQIGFDIAIANVLEVAGGVLTGRVLDPIVDSDTKLATLRAECAALGIEASQALAIGDGANDIPMLQAAGLGVAYHGHPKAVAAADASIRVGDLTAVLYAQGINMADWETG
ncbi:MAG: phosphoserine phosphatase SerB [Pseudomonadota bacterium]